jgi:hypothetical protein
MPLLEHAWFSLITFIVRPLSIVIPGKASIAGQRTGIRSTKGLTQTLHSGQNEFDQVADPPLFLRYFASQCLHTVQGRPSAVTETAQPTPTRRQSLQQRSRATTSPPGCC